MKKRLCALSLAAVLLSACANTVETQDRRETKTLQMAVQEGVSENSVLAAELFASKVEELSDGSLTIRLSSIDNPVDELGGFDIALMTNEEISRISGNFSSYSSPFYFNDYRHLSLSLNSQSFTDIIRDSTLSLIDALPIAALYDGSSMLVSAREVLLDTMDSFEEVTICIESDEQLKYILEELGAKTVSRSQPDRIASFNSGRYYAIECGTAELDQLVIPPKNEEITISDVFCSARINWIFLSQSAREGLSEFEQAVIDEAIAYAVFENDRAVLEKENSSRSEVERIGGKFITTNYGEFSEISEGLLKESVKYNSLWDWEMHAQVRKLALRSGA